MRSRPWITWRYNARDAGGIRMSASMDFPRRRFLIAAGGVLLSARGAPAQSAAEILVAAIQDGGKVIYLRHAATNQREIDTGRLGDRAGQRNLSSDGMRQAGSLGRALRALRVPLNEILASPVFRARDTAELAFGEGHVRVTMDLVADDYAGGELRAMIEATRRLLRTPPGPGMNRVLVGHRTPLEMATGRMFPDDVLPEGAMAVFLPGAAPQLLGTITTERLVLSADSRGALS
ncbi:MAG: histidine phosphatase family protein [Vicinamibacterales bacterium]